MRRTANANLHNVLLKPQRFIRYQKCAIVELFERQYFRGKFVKDSRHYYEVFSSALGGRCGHRHKTSKAAEPCLTKFRHCLAIRRKSLGRDSINSYFKRRFIDETGNPWLRKGKHDEID